MDHRPSVNDPVVLRDHDHREYRSRVEDTGPDALTVARPLDLPADRDVGPGAELLVTWSCPRGIAVLPVRLVGTHTEGDLRLWSTAVLGAGWVEQRRRFVRVPASGPLTLRPRDDDPAVEAIAGTLIEISEGALRCVVEAGTADHLAYDEQVTAGFRFGDGEFAVPARIGVRRPGARPAELAELVVVFDEPVQDADALRKQIFAQQLLAVRARH